MSLRTRCLFVVCLSCVACSTPSSKDQSTTPMSQAVVATAGTQSHGPSSPTIAVLQTRDRRIELHLGTRVTVRNNQGELVAEDITLDELSARDPFLYDLCRASFATNDSAFLDARLDARHDTPKLMGLVGD